MLRPVSVGCEERQVDVDNFRGAEFFLGFFGFFLEALHGGLVVFEVNAGFFFELVQQVVDDAVVEVLAAQVRVAVGRFYFKHAVAQLQNRHVKGAAAKVKDDDFFFFFLIQAVGQRRGRGLVDNTLDFQPGDFPGVFGGLALAVVEVGRHGNHRFCYRFA